MLINSILYLINQQIMKKQYLFFGLFLFLCLGLQAQMYNVTLKVDMSQQTVKDTVSPAGSFQAALGTGQSDWTPGDNPMDDSDGDNIWEITLSLPAGTYEYKFTYTTDGTDNWESPPGACTVNGNRELVVSKDTVLDSRCYGSCDPLCPAGTYTATFRVDMANEPFMDTVSVAGNLQVAAGFMNDWTPGQMNMTDADNDSIFEVTVTLPAGTYSYKYTTVTNGAANWEGVPNACQSGGNRELVLMSDTTLDVICYGTCDNGCIPLLPPVNVTFQVDMEDEIVSGKGVHATGDWQDPVWQKGADKMTASGMNPNIYQFTVSLVPAEYQYKYVNGDSDPEEEMADFLAGGCGVPNGLGGSNRLLDLRGALADTVLPPYIYNSCNLRNVSIDDDLNAQRPVKLFPNPAEDVLNVTFSNMDRKSYSIEVLNVNGQLVKQYANVVNEELTISLKDLSTGLYFVSIRNSEGERYTEKLLVK